METERFLTNSASFWKGGNRDHLVQGRSNQSWKIVESVKLVL